MFSSTEKYRELVASIVQDGDLYGNSSLRRILQVNHVLLAKKRCTLTTTLSYLKPYGMYNYLNSMYTVIC